MSESPTTLAEPHETSSHHDESHPRFLAHHFGSPQQQFDAGKFGMWLFLVTEILFFSGLFCAYAVYRSTHPEAFAHADRHLDPMLGGANTIVLLFSSLTMAWAVRASQLGQNKILITMLTITLGCASIFLGVKAVEYSHKWDLGILWASQFRPVEHHVEHSNALLVLSIPAMLAIVVTAIGFVLAKKKQAPVATSFWMLLCVVAVTFFAGVGIGKAVPAIEQAISGTSPELDDHFAVTAEHAHGAVPSVAEDVAAGDDMVYTGIFFSIYYVMTGLHAIHILAGMGTLSWLLWRSLRHDFGPDYFGPVDYVGLYWHLVDLIWIYLFPLLYLIG